MVGRPLKQVAVVALLATSFPDKSIATNYAHPRDLALATEGRSLIEGFETYQETAIRVLDYCIDTLAEIKQVEDTPLLEYHISHQSCGEDDDRNITTVTVMGDTCAVGANCTSELSEVIATVGFSCNDVITQRECNLLHHCESDNDCRDFRTWCRPTKNRLVSTKSECVPYREIGESCFGFGIENFQGQYCRPGLKCVGQDWDKFDASGICAPIKSPCQDDNDCIDLGGRLGIGSHWCRPTDTAGLSSECVPYSFEGENCTGLVPEFAQRRCAPNMSCKNTNPGSADAGGVCQQSESENEETLPFQGRPHSSCPDIGDRCITTQSWNECFVLESMGCQEIVAIESTCPRKFECDDGIDFVVLPDENVPEYSIAVMVIGATCIFVALLLVAYYALKDKTKEDTDKKYVTDDSDNDNESGSEDGDHEDVEFGSLPWPYSNPIFFPKRVKPVRSSRPAGISRQVRRSSPQERSAGPVSL